MYLKYRYFGAKSTKSSEKVQILALNVTIFQKFGPRADLVWPWLIYDKLQFLAKNPNSNFAKATLNKFPISPLISNKKKHTFITDSDSKY
jgi:hypothetical protein